MKRKPRKDEKKAKAGRIGAAKTNITREAARRGGLTRARQMYDVDFEDSPRGIYVWIPGRFIYCLLNHIATTSPQQKEVSAAFAWLNEKIRDKLVERGDAVCGQEEAEEHSQ